MKIAEIYAVLDALAPFGSQEEWDNSGLLIGSMDDEVKSVVLALDLNLKMIREAEPNTLFITHHPLIFRGLKNLNPSLYPASVATELIRKNCALIAAHTNYDKAVLNHYVLTQVLGFEPTSEEGFVLEFEPNMSFDNLALRVKSRLELSNLKVVRAGEYIKTAAFCAGSGTDLIGSFAADCFLSGDFKYHTALESYENKLSLIDITHYASERYFGASLLPHLQKNGIFAKITASHNPFEYL